jgi:hypothetical protein
MPVDDDAAESQLGDRALGLHDRGTRVLGGKGGERVEPVGVGRDYVGATVVECPAEFCGGFGRHLLGPRRDDGQDLHIDARVVHGPQSLLIDVRQFCGERFGSHRGRPHLVDEISGKHVFLKGDQRHGGPSRRESMPAMSLMLTSHQPCPPGLLATCQLADRYLPSDSLGPRGAARMDFGFSKMQ